MPLEPRQGPPQAQERPLTPRDIGLTADPGVGTEKARYDHIHSDGLTQFVRKAASEPRDTTTTLADDAELLLPVGANETHTFESLILYTSNTAGDIKAAFTGPSGSTVACNFFGPDAGIAVFDINAQVTRTSGTASGHGGDGTSRVLWARGIIRTGATAGNLALQWAQLASNGAATSVLLDSFLEMRRRA